MKLTSLRRAAALVLALALTLTLAVVPASAAAGDTVVINLDPISAQGVNLIVGESHQITATVVVNNVKVTSPGLTWNSSPAAVAKVDQSGKVEAVGKGSATITVYYEHNGTFYDKTCIVTVSAIEVTSISLNEHSLNLQVGETCDTLVAAVAPQTATDTSVTWSSNEPGVAKVDPSTGKVTAVAPGEAVITATANGGVNKADSCTVKVTAVPVGATGISMQTSTLTLVEGDSETLAVTYTPDGANMDLELEWSSDTPGVAEVNAATGEVTAVKEGQAIITATLKSDPMQTARCTVTVEKLPLSITKVSLDQASLSMTLGAGGASTSATLTVTIDPASADNRDLEWISSRPDVVSVAPTQSTVPANSATATATVTTHKAGEARITVRVKGNPQVQAACSIKVNPTPVAVTAITLDKTALTMVEGTTQSLKATVEPGDATDKTITWRSLNETVATVTTDGTVTAKAPGTTKIVVTSQYDQRIVAECAVEVVARTYAVTGVHLDTHELVLEREGLEGTLRATVTPTDAKNRNLKWSMDKEGVITLTPNADGTCQVIGLAPGIVAVTVTTEESGYRDTCYVSVSGLVMTPTSLPMLMGRAETLTVTAFGDAEGLDVKWESSNWSVVNVDARGRVSANFEGSATVTAEAGGYKAACAITVEEDMADAITVSVDAGMPLEFSSLISQLEARSQTKTKSALASLSGLNVSTDEGILYYGYTSPDAPGFGVGGETYYKTPGVDQRDLRDITFIPKSSFTGTAIISYSGRGTNAQSFNGTIRVNVQSSGDVAYSTASGRPVAFAASDFSAIWHAKTGKTISYITFEQPSANQGALYYNYSTIGQYSPRVSPDTRYYRTSDPRLDNISFVPQEGYTGTVEIPYYCTMVGGGTQAGKVTVTVYAPDGAGKNQVTYSVSSGGRVILNAEDFNDVCLDVNNASLRYVYFTLPSASEGVLYYDYKSTTSTGTRVSAGARYFRSSTPSISKVAFVAADGFTGTVKIPFTGYGANDKQFDGELVIQVSNASSIVRYTTDAGSPVTFNGLDFNEVCQAVNGTGMSRIRFEPPRASVGTLYHNYTRRTSTGTRVTDTSEYTRTALSSVTFVPTAGYTGTATIFFNGYDTAGAKFEGAVEITVGGSAETDTLIRYSTVSGGLVDFSADDFNNACRAATGDNLDFVRFTLPSESYGKLYYQYASGTQTGTNVSATASYYRANNSRLLEDVSFLAAANRTGTVLVEYNGQTTGGEAFTGVVEITVSAPQVNSIYYTGSSAPIVLYAEAFQKVCTSALGGTLSHIYFNQLPSASAGKLYLNYASPAQRGTAVTVQSKCDLSSVITFLPKAEYQGQVVIPYTGWDTRGQSYTGMVTISLSNAYCTTPFTDLSGYDWAKPSIEFLRYSGVTTGYSATQFGPGRAINRAEFTLMVCRAFQLDTGSISSFPDVSTGSVYARAVATAKDLGIVQGNNGLFSPYSAITRQSAMTMICRAMRAAGRSVPNASTSVLSAYADGSSVGAHARSSVAALIQMGAVRGNSSMQLKPTAAISRAEMAVILHRVLTS